MTEGLAVAGGAKRPASDSLVASRRLPARLPRARTLRLFVVRGLGVAALFGFEVTLAQWLGVAGYGAFSVMLAIALLTSRLAPLGWLNASTRLISAFTTAGETGLLKGVLILSYAWTGAGLLAATTLFAVVAPAFGYPNAIDLLWYVLPMSVTLTLLELHRYLLRGLNAGDVGEVFPMLFLPILAMAAPIFGVREAGAVAWFYAVVCALLVMASGACVKTRLPAQMRTATAAYRSREWSFAALAMLLGGLSDELVARTAVILLGALTTDATVGVYQAAARLSLMNVFVLRALTPVAAPQISVLHHAGDIAGLRSAYRRLCLFSLSGSLPFFICFVVAPRHVLALFGAGFEAGDWLLRILSAGYLISAAAGPCATALMMIGKERIYGWIALIGFLVNLAANYAAISYAGALGAAVATAGVVAGVNVLYAILFFRALRSTVVGRGSASVEYRTDRESEETY
jgi:O-antigen/teichoic acid export membrane protein